MANNTRTFQSLVDEFKLSELEVIDTLKAAKIVDQRETTEKVREQLFSNESIEKGFKFIITLFSSGEVKKGDYIEARKRFEKAHFQEQPKGTQKGSGADAKSSANIGSALTVQDSKDLAHLLSKQLGESSPSEEKINEYAVIIQALAKETNDPAKILAKAVIFVNQTSQQAINIALTKAVFSQPLDCTVEDVLAEVRKMESEAENVVQ
jgi:hypothetical protein